MNASQNNKRNKRNFKNKTMKNNANNGFIINRVLPETKKIIFKNFEFTVVGDILNDEINIYVGPEDDYCGHIEISMKLMSTAKLNTFAYGEDCNISGDLTRKDGTQILMDAIIKFLKKHCPYVKTIELFDASNLVCKDKRNTKKYNLFESEGIPLYDIYISKYGRGYYEEKYGFRLKLEESIHQHEKNVVAVNSIILFEDLISNFLEYRKQLKAPQIDFSNFLDGIKFGETLAQYLSRIIITDKNCKPILKFIMFLKNKKINGYTYIVNPVYYKNIF